MKKYILMLSLICFSQLVQAARCGAGAASDDPITTADSVEGSLLRPLTNVTVSGSSGGDSTVPSDPTNLASGRTSAAGACSSSVSNPSLLPESTPSEPITTSAAGAGSSSMDDTLALPKNNEALKKTPDMNPEDLIILRFYPDGPLTLGKEKVDISTFSGMKPVHTLEIPSEFYRVHPLVDIIISNTEGYIQSINWKLLARAVTDPYDIDGRRVLDVAYAFHVFKNLALDSRDM